MNKITRILRIFVFGLFISNFTYGADINTDGYTYIKEIYERSKAGLKGEAFPVYTSGRCFYHDSVATPQAALLNGWKHSNPDLGPIGDCLKFVILKCNPAGCPANYFDSISNEYKNETNQYLNSITHELSCATRSGVDILSAQKNAYLATMLSFREDAKFSYVKLEKNFFPSAYCYFVK